MLRLSLIPLCILLLFVGCTSGTDDSLPPTLRALNNVEEADRTINDAVAPESTAIPQSAQVPHSGIYQVEFITTVGKFLVEVNREWAPIGAERFHNLVSDKFFDDAAFFRVVPNFVVQFGLPADPSRNAKWAGSLHDEPVIQSNKRGFLTFAKGGPHSRTTQLFINYKDNARLDGMGFPAFGKVIEGMDVVDRINAEYGETPYQPTVKEQGNAYLSRNFPNLTYIQTARIVKDDQPQDDSSGT